ncbi:hypothetical protein SH528x_004043 [Novipirellula sp. SH528]|uniref:hypothetical protein n=1 Tax=Novipirellula sp. SH528 TaxID=3454466 RepID=UPI003F9ED46D
MAIDVPIRGDGLNDQEADDGRFASLAIFFRRGAFLPYTKGRHISLTTQVSTETHGVSLCVDSTAS